MVGSFLFALGSFPPYAANVDVRAVGVTYFVGSLFFTSAGSLQLVQTNDAGRGEPLRLLAWQPGRIEWWSAFVQWIGTLLFNVSTFAAMDTAFDLQQQERLVWAPDMFGSICFLIASSLAWVAVCGGWGRIHDRDAAWWMAALNLGGSVAFQVSAVAAFIDPDSGTVLDVPLANLGTFVGAVGFFAAAVILDPRRRRLSATVDPRAG